MQRTLFLLALALAACSSSGTAATPETTLDPSEPVAENESAKDPSTPSPTDPPPPAPTATNPGKPPPPTYPKDAGSYDANVPPGNAAFTQAEVQALFDNRCSPCHIGGTSGGMSLANDFTKATIGVTAVGAPSQKRIVKGDASKSYLLHKLKGTHLGVGGAGVRMPKGGPYLSANEIDRIGLYIDGL